MAFFTTEQQECFQICYTLKYMRSSIFLRIKAFGVCIVTAYQNLPMNFVAHLCCAEHSKFVLLCLHLHQAGKPCTMHSLFSWHCH